MQPTDIEHRTIKRRVYRDDNPRCEDCGRTHTTLIHFWVNNMPYWVCPECIKPYRGSILKPCICERVRAA